MGDTNGGGRVGSTIKLLKTKYKILSTSNQRLSLITNCGKAEANERLISCALGDKNDVVTITDKPRNMYKCLALLQYLNECNQGGQDVLMG